MRLAEHAEEEAFGLHPSVRAWGGEAQTKEKELLSLSSHKEDGVWPRRFLQVSAEQREEGGRGLPWARSECRPGDWSGPGHAHGRGIDVVLVVNAPPPAGKLEGGAHLVRRHLGAPLKARSAGSAHLQPLSALSQAVHRLSPQRRLRGAMKVICHRKARHRFSAKPSPGLSQETAYKIPNNDLMAYFPM